LVPLLTWTFLLLLLLLLLLFFITTMIGWWTAPVLASDEEPPATNRSLSTFSLTFDFTQTRIPLNPEVSELVAVTGAFLESRLDDAYPGMTVLLSIVETSFRLMQPFEIILDIEVQNLPTSPSVPTSEELDGAVAAILQDPSSLEALITVVEELPDANVFTTTTAITYSAQANGSSSTTRSSRNVVVGASAAAAALAALLLLGGGYQQWGGKNSNTNNNNRKPSNKSYQRGKTAIDGSGQTEAGETCGATTIATKSSHYNNNNNSNKQTRFAFDEGMSLTSSRSSVDWTTTPPPPYRRLAAEATGASELDCRVVTAEGEDDDDEEADCYGIRPLFSDAMYDGSEEDEKQRAAVDLLAQPSQASCLNSNSNNEAASRSSSDPIDTDDLTIDSYVPMRVVDLIKRWSRR
jgi:hypothetical protein